MALAFRTKVAEPGTSRPRGSGCGGWELCDEVQKSRRAWETDAVASIVTKVAKARGW